MTDAWSRAVLARDRPGYDRLISRRDPSFATRAAEIYRNLTAVPLLAFDVRVEPDRRALSGQRLRVLGGGWVQAATLSWRLAGEVGDAEHRVWLTFVDEAGTVRLAGTVDAPAGTTEAQPVWWLGPVAAAGSGESTVIAGAGQSAGSWADLVERARRGVRRHLPAPAAATWSGAVVVEIPATATQFAAALGSPPAAVAGLAANTRREGSGATAPLRILVNPRLATASRARREAVLAHEMVHVATSSPDSAAPLWLVEGFAEWVAWRVHPDLPVDGAAAVLAAVRRGVGPRALPADSRFDATAGDLEQSYATAWLVCRYLAETYSAGRLGRFYAAMASGDTLDDAARGVLGVGAGALSRDWQRSLTRRAGG